MKLKYWLIFVLLCSCGSLWAQGGKLQIGIGGGAAIPLGKYTGYTTPSLGYATIGGGGKIDVSYSFHRLFAAYVTGYYGMNPVNADSLAKGIWGDYKGADTVTVSVGPYSSWATLVGLKFHTARDKKFSVSAGMSVGMMVTTTPDIYREIGVSSPMHQDILPATSTGFCLQPQVEFQMHLGGPISLALFGEYSHASTKFTFITEDGPVEPEQNIQTVNAGLKLIFSLGGVPVL